MLTRLLESRKTKDRPVWGGVASTIAHTTVIGVAVFATAQAKVDHRSPAQVIRWVAPAVTPPAPARAPASAPRSNAEPPAPRPVAVPSIDRIDVALPPVNLTLPPVSPGPFTSPGPATAPEPAADPSGDPGSTEPFSADQVERQVFLRPGNAPPRYPSALRAAGIEGHVIVLFVVNEAGRVELSSVRFIRSNNPLFEAAVRDALTTMRFGAAEVGGKKVRQLVQLPFAFSLAR